MKVFHSPPIAWVALVAVVGFSDVSSAWSPTIAWTSASWASSYSSTSSSTSSDNHHPRRPLRQSKMQPFTSTGLYLSSQPSDSSSSDVSFEDIKTDLVRICSRPSKPTPSEVRSIVRDLEELAEQRGVGQSSSLSGLLSGEWDLLYAPQDVTRSSPFFWAFTKAFPDTADQIFSITDAIPSPIKVVGPATQKIEFSTESGKGTFVSQVKVATLGGMATSLMTTKAAITGIKGVDGIQLKIETTKPEESTVLQTLLGPLGPIVNENIPAFPSGEALEKVLPGSSEVIMRTTFCDEGIRISRNDEKPDDIFVWRRREFARFEML